MKNSIDPTLYELKERVCIANLQLHHSNLVPLTFGNVSERQLYQGSYVVGIKPSGVPYRELRPELIVLMNPDGSVLGESLRPSSDTPTHLYLYSQLPAWSGICHTHSVYATAWAQAGREIPILGTTHADYLPYPVPCTGAMAAADIQGDYEMNTGVQIVKYLTVKGRLDSRMVLVRSHGAFAFGLSGVDAVESAVALESVAQMALLTLAIEPEIAPIPEALGIRHYSRKHGRDRYYGQLA